MYDYDQVNSLLRREYEEHAKDYSKLYGYPQSLDGDIGYDLMRHKTRYNPIAGRLNLGMPLHCWNQGFTVKADGDEGAANVLENELSLLKQTKLSKYLCKADQLNRIGRFAVLFVGFPDGNDPKEALAPFNVDKLSDIYYKPFSYVQTRVIEVETDVKNPRYGLPTLYQLNPLTRESKTQGAHIYKVIIAHWTRVIHLSENALETDVEGMGYIEPIYNDICNIEKAGGGASAAYVKNMIGKMVFEIDKEFANALAEDEELREDHKQKADEFVNEQRTQLTVTGANTKTIVTPHNSPKDTILVSYWNVACYTKYPIRVLTGEGGGQYAGNEDRIALNSLICARQNSFCSEVVRTFLERLASVGLVRMEPQYEIDFALQEESSEGEQVANNKTKAETFKVLNEAANASPFVDRESLFNNFGFRDIEIESDTLNLDLPDERLNAQPNTNVNSDE